VPVAHANDGGGSIRLPASHNGLVGLKPTRGRELGGGEGPLAIANDLCVSRTVRDTAAFLSVVENKNGSGVMAPIGYVAGPSSRRLKIAMILESTGGKLEPVVQLGIRQTAEKLQEMGHEVHEMSLPYDGAAFIDAFIHFWAAGTLGLIDMVGTLLGPDVPPEEVLEPWTLGLAEMARKRGPDKCVEAAMQMFPQVAASLEEFFQSHDVILSPTLTVPPFKIGYHSPAGDFDTIYQRVIDAVGYTPSHNAAGTPAISLPLSQSEHGLPVGNQFAAWHGNERTLLELAYELEEAMPWGDRRPQVYA
jgi:amidase